MTDPLEFLPTPTPLLEHPVSEHRNDLQQEKTVMVELPVDVLAVLEQHGYRSGQTQTQAILEVLRSALGLEPAASQLQPEAHTPKCAKPAAEPATAKPVTAEPVTAEPETNEAAVFLTSEVERLQLRLRQLEALIPKVEDLAGKSIAF